MFIEIEGETLELLPERALYWLAMEMLIIADIGWAFTKKTYIESSITEFDHIQRIAAKRSVKRVTLCGDAAPPGHTIDKALLTQIKSWSKNLKAAFYIASPKPSFIDEIKEYGIAAWADPLILPPFVFSSEPVAHDKYFTFSGHVHPHVILKKGDERVSFPCFQFKSHVAILPAFTEDALSQPISWTSDERIIAIDGSDLISI